MKFSIAIIIIIITSVALLNYSSAAPYIKANKKDGYRQWNVLQFLQSA